jgi:hypothetical protein
VREGLLPLTVDQPRQAAGRIETAAMVRTDQQVGAARDDFRIRVEAGVVVIAGRQGTLLACGI